MTKKKTNSRKISAKKSCNWKGKYEESEAAASELFNKNVVLRDKAELLDALLDEVAKKAVSLLKQDEDWVRDIARKEVDDHIGDLHIS